MSDQPTFFRGILLGPFGRHPFAWAVAFIVQNKWPFFMIKFAISDMEE
jgi:hypothetical protein